MRDIILHCSKSEYGNTALITKWHIDRGFWNCGYHLIILNGKISSTFDNLKFLNGHIETGRPLNEDGAHVKGFNNNIGICLIGNSGEFTSQQIETCHNIIKTLKQKYNIGKVKQHSDYDSNKSFCAGFDKEMMERFNA